MTWLSATEYLSHKWLRICSIDRNPVLPSVMTYHRIFDNSNTTGATSGTGFSYPSEVNECTSPFFSVAQSVIFCIIVLKIDVNYPSYFGHCIVSFFFNWWLLMFTFVSSDISYRTEVCIDITFYYTITTHSINRLLLQLTCIICTSIAHCISIWSKNCNVMYIISD